MMIDIPGKLYLGRETHPNGNGVAPDAAGDPFLLSARDLTTHAVCLGMTGTGKTGLGIVLLEEALLQGIPALIIDPKGDITNLALNFPALSPAEFKPWLDAEEAERQGISLDALAAQTAQRWREGLAAWDITPERLHTLHERAAIQIYTPGSDAGMTVNILQGLNPPDAASGLTWARDAEILRERIAEICSAILGLAGIESDPLKGREHILLATIFESAWRAGQSMDIGLLIRMIQDPPIARVGVFDMNVFYPKDERFELAMALNNLVASPSFSVWQTGEPLDIGALLKPLRTAQPGSNPAGQTRASIFSLAHLNDAERQFFITLLLSQLVMWMRAQTGTSVLRALVYFDEVFGYCPPFPRNPPTKTPIMTLIKQGRAAGLGMFLATQNPADLDYKGLSNIGTWFIGRLRTARDRSRALEGLESAGVGFDREQYEAPLSTLPPRVFLAQNATGMPRFLQTRWSMSFLRGPLTRDQIRTLQPQPDTERTDHGNPYSADPPERPATPVLHTPSAQASISNLQFSNPQSANHESPLSVRPALAPDVREVFLPPMETPPLDPRNAATRVPVGRLIYQPYLLASARLRIADRASGVMHDRRHTYLVALNPVSGALPDFASARELIDFDPNTLRANPLPGIDFAPLPAGLSARWMKQAERLLVEHVYRHAALTLWYNRTLKLYGQVDESQRDFRERCEAAAKLKRDAEATRVGEQYERRMATLQDRLAREQRELTADRTDLDARKREELLTNAESIFNFVIGRRRRGTGRSVAWGATKRRQTQAAEEDVRESEDAITQLNTDLQQIGAEYRAALDALNNKWLAVLGDIQEVPLAPRKSDIFADVVALAWVPEAGD
jgi:hypothetical protein